MKGLSVLQISYWRQLAGLISSCVFCARTVFRHVNRASIWFPVQFHPSHRIGLCSCIRAAPALVVACSNYCQPHLMNSTNILNYGSNDLQTIRVYRHDAGNHLSLILIHGGAWRDPRNSFTDFEELVAQLPSTINTFGVNYRLSPAVKHPVHLEDVVSAIEFLAKNYKVEHVGLIGHSVGATLALQVLNYRTILPGLKRRLGIKMNFLVFLDGIYDVPQLVEEYPTYSSFVNEAFETKQDYAKATPVSSTMPQFDILVEKCVILLVQSTEDELLSGKQTELMADFLQAQSIPYEKHIGAFGAHEQVYRHHKVARLVTDAIGDWGLLVRARRQN